jgi:glutaredoxin 3
VGHHSTMRFVMYTTKYCGYCERARRLLRSRGIAFEDIDVTRDPETRRRVMTETGHLTVPVILLDGKLLGGSDELVELDESGGLDTFAA